LRLAYPGACRRPEEHRRAAPRPQLAPIDSLPVHLQDNVGEHSAPKVATLGERTYLLHRHGDGKIRLSCYDRALRPLPLLERPGGHSRAGRPCRRCGAARPDRRSVNVWPASFRRPAGNGYFFQRFNADTGAPVDVASISFLFHDGSGPHRSLTWNGSRFAVCGVAHAGNYRLQLRQMDGAANLQGSEPVTLSIRLPRFANPACSGTRAARVTRWSGATRARLPVAKCGSSSLMPMPRSWALRSAW
jgi:hypothetical protein